MVGGLATALTTTSYNSVTAISNYVKNIEGGYIRIGNMVVVNVRCTVNINIPPSTPFISGLPRPIIQYGAGYGGAPVSNNKQYNMTVLGIGSIGHSHTNDIPVNDTLIMSAIYFAK